MAFRNSDMKNSAVYIGVSDTANYDNAKGLKKKSMHRVCLHLFIYTVVI